MTTFTNRNKALTAAKDAACILGGCLLMMSGPILSALGLLKG